MKTKATTSTVTSSHTTLGSVNSIGPHLVPFKPGSTLSKFHGSTKPHKGLDTDLFPITQPHYTQDLTEKKSMQPYLEKVRHPKKIYRFQVSDCFSSLLFEKLFRT